MKEERKEKAHAQENRNKYRTAGSFRGRKFSQISRIGGLSRKFSPRKISSRKLSIVGVVIGLSAIHKNFLPRKLPAIRYTNTQQAKHMK